MKIQAVNTAIIIVKDKSGDDKDLYIKQNAIPEPYSGVIDSIGYETDEYKVGDRIAFCDDNGLYLESGDTEYVVITQNMIVGKLK